ncbi:hypothetical protein [Plantactinospora sp. CA-290183]|uniref:hypothetical protein n=1 Tax=Plantactinospora sp. CA-290183 TaxID=3240006 RepID=UPI003D8D3D8F
MTDAPAGGGAPGEPGRCHRPHLPQRPIWLCRSCAAEWPCLTARTLLPIEYVADPTALHVYLATMLQAAIDDLHRLNPEPGPDPQRLYARFLGWVKPRLEITRNRFGTGADGNRRRSRTTCAPPPGCALAGECRMLRWLSEG